MSGVPDERGQVGGVEAVVFGMLVFVVGTLVIANAWGVVDAKMAAAAAAREAARTYVKAPAGSDGSDALSQAVVAGQDTLRSLGRRDSANRVALLSGSFTRCATVTFRVSVPVPLITLPWVGDHGKGFTASATHSEVVDPFRGGLTGDPRNQGAANCG